MTEQQIQKKIIEMLEKEYNAYTVKVVSASRNGVPDIIASIDGMFVGIEVKRPQAKRNVSKLQEYNLTKIASSGGFSMVAWNTEMVKDFIDSEVLHAIFRTSD